MKKRNLTANLGLKIASLFLAALLWFLVTNINDPVDSVRFSNIPVSLRNTSSITDNNQIYEILDGTDTISTVTVYAPRSIVDTLNRDNIVAIADLDDMTASGDSYNVSVQLSTNKYNNQIQSIMGSSDIVKLSVEDKISRNFALEATTTGSVSEGYIIGEVMTDQNQIRVTGARSIVEKIDTASVNVEVTGYTTNIGTTAEIHLYDDDGNEISKDNLKLSSLSVGVNVTILETKRVPVTYQITGVPADGYAATGEVVSEPDTVLLAGKASFISGVEEINVSDVSLDITGLTDNLEATIDLSGYLPGNVYFGDEDFNGIATVVAYIEPVNTKTLEIPYSQIELTDIPEGYEASISTETSNSFTLRISGLKEDTDSVGARDVAGSIDVSKIVGNADSDDLSGSYSGGITLSLPGGVTTQNTAEATVVLERSGE